MANKKFLNPINLVNLSSDPSTASEGDIYYNTTDDVVKVYANGTWVAIGAGDGSEITVSDTAPLSPETGDAWYKNDTGEFYIYDGTYWVEVNGVIGSSGALTNIDSIVYPDYITFDTTPETSSEESGTLSWDTDFQTLKLQANDTTLQLGQEHVVRVKNASGSTAIPNMSVVMFAGSAGDTVTVSPAISTQSYEPEMLLGITTEEIDADGFGFVTQFGFVNKVNTSDWELGDLLYSDPANPGQLTNVKPSAPNWTFPIAAVTRVHASTGRILVRAIPGLHLHDLVDVAIDSELEDQVLRYSSSASVWVNTAENIITAKNVNESTIDAFMPVYIDTETLGQNQILFDLANATGSAYNAKMPADAITTASVASGEFSKLATHGAVRGADLSAYSDGDLLYVAPEGGLTNIRPTGNNSIQPFARVISVDNGTLFVLGNTFASYIESLPNLETNKVWLGTSGRPVETTLDTSIVSENTNLYFTDERAQDAAAELFTNGVHNGASVEYNDSTGLINITNTGVTSLYGTTNEVEVSSVNGEVTISIPDSPVFITPNIGVATATSINGTTIPTSETLVVSGDLDDYSLDTHNHTVDGLSNVVITSATDGQALVWDTATSKWVNETISAGDAFPSQTGNSGKFLQTDGTDVSWQNVDLSAYAPIVNPVFTNNVEVKGQLSFDVVSGTPGAFINFATIPGLYSSLDIISTDIVFFQSVGDMNISSQANVLIGGTSGEYIGTASSNNQIATIGDLTLEKITDGGATSTNAITISNTTQSTTPTSGALIISGGVGIAKDVWIDGDLHVNGTTATLFSRSLSTRDNLIYLNESSPTEITNAVGDGTYVTYTADNDYLPGESIRITGIDPAGYNISSGDLKTIYSATDTQFVVEKTTTGTYVSGGDAYAKSAVNPDLGFAGGYNDGTYAHAGLFRDASDGIFKFFQGYTPEPDEAVNIDTTHASFALADISAEGATFTGTLSAATLNLTNALGYAYGGTGLTYLGTAGQVLQVNGYNDAVEWGLNLPNGVGDPDYVLGMLNTTTIGWIPGIPSDNLNVPGAVLVTTGETDPMSWLLPGTAGQVLTVNSTEDAVEWTTPSGGGGGPSTTTTSITVNTAVVIESFDKTVSRTAEAIIQITQGTDYYSSKVLLIHDGTNVKITEYAILESTVGAIPITISSAINGSNVELLATITDAATTNATAKVVLIEVAV
jgi:hypothetical protein